MFTVEGLHSAFEKIDDRVRSLIDKGRTESELGRCVEHAWQEFFHRGLSSPAVQGMVRHYQAVYRPTGSTRTTRKTQKGGMAPLDYTMGPASSALGWQGPGTTDTVYGRFPVEMGATPSVVKSLDRFYESPIGRHCDSTGGYPAPPQAGGKRSGHSRKTRSKRKEKAQHGGGIFDAIFMPHAPTSVPRNVIESGLSAVQGRPIMNPAASPVTYTPSLTTVDPKPFNPTAISEMTSLAPVYQGY
jgi:hypothetical protein